MRAMTVTPGEPGSAELSELPEPEIGPGELLVEPLVLGSCSAMSCSAGCARPRSRTASGRASS